MSNRKEYKQIGMTLIELTVVLLILTSLATIALRSTTGLVEQTRWEETKKRHEEIKKAIIGDPDLVINDQPDISGFVADMGRLPNNIRELLSEAYCKVDYTKDLVGCPSPTTNWIKQNPGYCESDYTKNQASCPSTDWNTTGLAAPTTSTQLGFGWNGPYLQISGSAEDEFVVSDGWATSYKILFPSVPPASTLPATTTAELDAVNDYGWLFSVATAAPITLTLQSYGKDKASGGTGTYDVDYPADPIILRQSDWTIDINTGIKVKLSSPFNGGCDAQTCSDPSKSDAASCTEPPYLWFATPACSISTFNTESLCKLGGGVWTVPLYRCSDGSYLTQTVCVTNSQSWGNIAGKQNCIASSKNWIYNIRPIWMKFTYKDVNGENNLTLVSNIVENGESQEIVFVNPAPATPFPPIPVGDIKVSIYQNNTPPTSPSTEDLYPASCMGLNKTDCEAADSGDTTNPSTLLVNGMCNNLTINECTATPASLNPPGTIFYGRGNKIITLFPHKAIPQIVW